MDVTELARFIREELPLLREKETQGTLVGISLGKINDALTALLALVARAELALKEASHRLGRQRVPSPITEAFEDLLDAVLIDLRTVRGE